MSRGYNFIFRVLFLSKVRDTQCGAKIITYLALKSIINELVISNWGFDVELIHALQKRKFTIKEFPTQWDDQKDSRINVTKVPFMMFVSTIRLRLIDSPFNFLVSAYDSLPKQLKIHKLFK